MSVGRHRLSVSLVSLLCMCFLRAITAASAFLMTLSAALLQESVHCSWANSCSRCLRFGALCCWEIASAAGCDVHQLPPCLLCQQPHLSAAAV